MSDEKVWAVTASVGVDRLGFVGIENPRGLTRWDLVISEYTREEMDATPLFYYAVPSLHTPTCSKGILYFTKADAEDVASRLGYNRGLVHKDDVPEMLEQARAAAAMEKIK